MLTGHAALYNDDEITITLMMRRTPETIDGEHVISVIACGQRIGHIIICVIIVCCRRCLLDHTRRRIPPCAAHRRARVSWAGPLVN